MLRKSLLSLTIGLLLAAPAFAGPPGGTQNGGLWLDEMPPRSGFNLTDRSRLVSLNDMVFELGLHGCLIGPAKVWGRQDDYEHPTLELKRGEKIGDCP